MLRKSLLVLVVGLFAMPLIAQADTEFKKPYFMQHVPTITGTVSAVSEHSFTVVTDGGESMTFHIDTRSLMPSKLTPETRVMLEYALMDNGDHRAVRVMPIGEGEIPAAMEGERPRAEGDWDDNEMAPVSSSLSTESASTSGDAETYGDDIATNGTNGSNDDYLAQNTTTDTNVDDADELPRTASPWPIVQMIGGLAVAAGAGTLLFRRRRRA